MAVAIAQDVATQALRNVRLFARSLKAEQGLVDSYVAEIAVSRYIFNPLAESDNKKYGMLHNYVAGQTKGFRIWNTLQDALEQAEIQDWKLPAPANTDQPWWKLTEPSTVHRLTGQQQQSLGESKKPLMLQGITGLDPSSLQQNLTSLVMSQPPGAGGGGQVVQQSLTGKLNAASMQNKQYEQSLKALLDGSTDYTDIKVPAESVTHLSDPTLRRLDHIVRDLRDLDNIDPQGTDNSLNEIRRNRRKEIEQLRAS